MDNEVKRLKELMGNRLQDIIELKVNNAALTKTLKDMRAARNCCEKERQENLKLLKKLRKSEKVVQ